MYTVIIFIVILSILVFAHEFGHFITARLTGMKVYEFAIGFPPRLFGVYKDPKTGKFVWVWRNNKHKKEKTSDIPSTREEFPATLYSLHLLPLGGFCNIKGENGENPNDKDSFLAQKPWKRFIVLAAGVVMNFILAVILFSVGFLVGLPADISEFKNDKQVIIVESPRVIVQFVDKNSPAEQAQIKFGDEIVSLDNIAISNSSEVIDYVSPKADKTILLGLKRDGQEVQISVAPQDLDKDGHAQLGIMLVDAGIIRYPWYVAIYKGFSASIFAIVNIFVAFGILIKNLVMGQGLAFDVAGPVGIAVLLGESARLGISYLINVTAMISLSLAAINILPIPALDGGRILFLAIEKVLRRPVPLKYEQIAHTVGFVLLMILIVLVTSRDIFNLLN